MMLIKIFLVLALAALSAQAREEPIPKVLDRTKTSAIFPYPKDQVWIALMAALADLQIQPLNSDKTSGTVFLQTAEGWGRHWGEANYVVALLSTKEVRQNSTWQGMAASGNVRCKDGDRGIDVRINLRLSGCNGWRAIGTGYSCIWETLESNGYIEGLILNHLKEQLPDRKPYWKQNVPASKPILAEAARIALSEAQKIRIAQELGANRQEILVRLVNAKIALENFAASSQAQHLPQFVKSLREGLSLFREGLERPALNEAAYEHLAVAARMLRSYEEKGREDPQSRKPWIGQAAPQGPIIK